MSIETMPKVLSLGFGEVVEVKYLERLFGISRRSAFKYLKALRIDLFYVKTEAYFSLNTLKRILFVLSKPGAPGFVFPGARKKNDQSIYLRGTEKLTCVTDDILEAAADPKIIREMAQVNSVSSMSLLGKFPPPQRMEQAKKDESGSAEE